MTYSDADLNIKLAGTAVIDRVTLQARPDVSAAATLGFAFGVRIAALRPEFAEKVADFLDDTILAARERGVSNSLTSLEFDPEGFVVVETLSPDEAIIASTLILEDILRDDASQGA